MIGCLSQSYQTEHRYKTIAFYQSFGSQEMTLEETRFLDDKTDTRRHIIGHASHCLRQQLSHKHLFILRQCSQFGQYQTRQRITAAGNRQDIVAGRDTVTVVGIAVEHVVAYSGIGYAERGIDSLLGKVVWRDSRIVFQGQIGHCLFQFTIHLHNQTTGTSSLRTEVGMAERVGDCTVEINQEITQLALHLFITQIGDERFDQCVQVSEEDRISGDRRHMAV